MRKIWIGFIVFALLCLGGCGEKSTSLSVPEESDVSSAVSSVHERLPTNYYEDFRENALSYAEFFSTERYWTEDGMGFKWYDFVQDQDQYGVFYTKNYIDGEKEVFYRHPSPMADVFRNNEYLFYFRSDRAVYRIFVPTKQLDLVYEGEEDFRFVPITNQTIVLIFKNPSNLGKIPGRDETEEDFYYLYHIPSGETKQIFAQDYGQDSLGYYVYLSPENLYEIK